MTRRQRKQSRADRLTGLANLNRKIANANRRYYAAALAGHWGSHEYYSREALEWRLSAKRALEERDRNG